MIEIRGLRRAFGAVQAVDGVSFAAADARITGLLGPNGAGKTTTLRMLYTLLKPDAGSIRIDDVDALPTRSVRANASACCRMRGVCTSASRRARTSSTSGDCRDSIAKHCAGARMP